MAETSSTISRKPLTPHLLRSEQRERRRNVLHLIHAYLTEHRYTFTAETLRSEATELSSSEYKVCENVDLEIVLQEYQSYYRAKFQKEPRILRKLDAEERAKKPTRRKEQPKEAVPPQPPSDAEDFHFEIVSLSDATRPPPQEKPSCEYQTVQDPQEYRDMVDRVMRHAAVVPGGGTTWDECVGLGPIVERLKEAVVYPQLYPELFDGVEAWRGVLLYGPPGTGKTMLARCVATTAAAGGGDRGSFFNVTAAGFVSKWRGESEKMVAATFEAARRNAPATVFIDEIDALACDPTDHHGATRRFRSELLTQMDGLLSTSSSVFVLASTNRPWDLDAALLRRFERRLLVPPPDDEAKLEILRRHLRGLDACALSELRDVVRETMGGFTGADVRLVCKAIAVEAAAGRARTAERGGRRAATTTTNTSTTTAEDVRRAARGTRPCRPELRRYEEWGERYGCQ